MQTRIFRITLVALLSQILLSWPLWQSAGRLFPSLPLQEIPLFDHKIWIWSHTLLTLALIGVCFLFAQRKIWLMVLTVWMLWMSAQDMNRLQVWLYFYLLTWLALYKTEGPGALRLLLTAVYFWGGFYKLTPYFAEDNYPWFCAAFDWLEPLGYYPKLGYAVAIGELLLAPGLLWPVTGPVFRWLALLFHIFIIAALGPLGHNWNTIVIPWNLVMLLLVWFSFHPNENTAIHLKKNWLVIIIAWLLPALNMFGLYPASLSWEMYTNTQDEITLYNENPMPPYPALEQVWQKHAFDAGSKLLLDDWAMDEMQVPPVKFQFLYPVLKNKLCRSTVHPSQTGLWLLQVKRWDKTDSRLEKRPCQ